MISTFMQKIPAHFYIVPYRGYADSKGTPSEVAFKSDLQCIFQDILLLKTSNKFLLLSPLVLYGQSLGCALALYTYRMYYHPKDDILVILENPFISIPMMLKTMFQGWFYSLRWFVTESWDNQQEISFIKDQNTTASTKILFITAEQDEIIPHWHSFHLFKMLLSMGKTKLIDPKQSCDSFEILEKSDPDLKDISKNDSMAYEIRDREAYIEYVAGPKNINSRTVQMVLLRKGSHNDLWIQPCYFPIIKQYLTLVEN